MFHYLENPDIPKTTNGLESFFGHLKQNISLHRGLSKEHYKNYIKLDIPVMLTPSPVMLTPIRDDGLREL
jgi:hypothetical protein